MNDRAGTLSYLLLIGVAMSEDSHSLDDFTGLARLFPLPNLVLFPRVAQPLHIFEPRYRQMLADALEADRLIAMALLRPGWEAEYEQKPPIYPVVCLGRVHHEQRLPDGRYNLLLQGLGRARILEEVITDLLYRIVRVELLEDEPVPLEMREQALHQQLAQKVAPFFSVNAQAEEQVQKLLHSDLPLGALCDIFSFALPLPLELKQQLLAEVRVEERVRLLLANLGSPKPPEKKAQPSQSRFPPEFSSN
jgi:Lon protease-like protein